MDLAITVFGQVVVMFLLMAVGFLCFKLKFVTNAGKGEMTNVLLYIVLPAIIVSAYQVDYHPEMAKNLIIALGLAFFSHIVAIVLGKFLISEKKDPDFALSRFAVIYSNCGFMAIPLISALYGGTGVFYASAYMTVFNFLSWTHGYIMLSGKGDKSVIKKAFLSPSVIAVFVGLLLFFLRIRLPGVLSDTIGFIAPLNTPLAMIITGISLAQADLKQAFLNKRNYYVVLLINVVIPLTVTLLYAFLPLNEELVLVSLIARACPTATLTLLFATRFQKNEIYAAEVLTLSNIFSILSIPAIVFLFQALRGMVA